MSPPAVCDACKLAFPYDATLNGQPTSCPACKKPVQAPLSEAQLAELTAEGQRFARENKIRLGESCNGQVVAEDHAATILDDLNACMPAVSPLYQPSGIFPKAGIPKMILGTIGGAVAGLLALVIVAALCSLIVGPVLWINMALLEAGWIWGLTRLLLIVVGFMAFLVTFLAAAVGNTIVISAAGRSAKNRSYNVASGFAMVGGAISILTLGAILWWSGEWIQEKTGLTSSEFDLGMLIVVLGGGFVTVLAAGYYAGSEVGKDHFCEECQQFMTIKKIKKLPIGALKAITKAIGQQNMSAAASLCCEAAGNNGEIRLSYCPQCAKGFLEASLDVKIQWQKDNQVKSKEESRLIASVALGPADVERFKAVPRELGNLWIYEPNQG